LLDQTVRVFMQAFSFPNLSGTLMLVSFGLALAFAAVWLAGYMPPIFKKRWLWVVAVISAFLTWACIAFIQVPFQNWAGQLMTMIWNQKAVAESLVISGIPTILLSGLVQEGAKLLPVVLFWWLDKRRMDAQTGLIAGAVAGAGFGIFEAVWIHNTIFNAGWTLQAVASNGPMALLGFWERFFTVGFHIGASALAGYGLAKGKAWQFYLLASLLHGIINYSAVLFQAKVLGVLTVEIYVAAAAILVSAAALWLRWRKQSPVVNVSPDMPRS
jgi:RsiW-degrading membrane proteinase PrsW (M82 family)